MQKHVQNVTGSLELRVFEPAGATEVTHAFAPRLDTIEGKTICELYNDMWQGIRTFPLIRDLLWTQFPTANFIPYTDLPRIPQSVDADSFAPILKALKAKKCDAVICPDFVPEVPRFRHVLRILAHDLSGCD